MLHSSNKESIILWLFQIIGGYTNMVSPRVKQIKHLF